MPENTKTEFEEMIYQGMVDGVLLVDQRDKSGMYHSWCGLAPLNR